MKRLFSAFLLTGLLFSCDQKTEDTTSQIQNNDIANATHAREQFADQHKTKVAVLGVFHFNNPGLDSYKPKFTVDILSEKRQSEIELLLKSLSEFKPTKILLEVSRKENDSLLTARYQQYLKGEYDICEKRNEIFQLGFRLAEQLGHQDIYASDVKGSNWFGAEIDWDNYDEAAYQRSLDQYKKTHRYDYEEIYETHDSLKTVTTLTEYFKLLNDPEDRLKSHQAYLTNTILTGAGDLYIGADIVARWYQRNLKIFANTYDLADFSKEDRILLIYGAGHVWQLRQLFKDSPDFEYVEINEYL
ncbi:DUF5694 domain-containing protein [Gramella sp. KN1008]|uniref:DUF5694 domain-containing protein n=1 Tax=Gramella sp. KN1008 TaxID=2529298 RepID=UPI00103F60A7|nr:DUF5694 domain-containing protein [Gramella sp. KN1008]TBW29972.1 hypothetical protein EZJ28_00780 [Gramella sp. KN1008]